MRQNVQRDKRNNLNVWYIAMQFPVPSETFAGNDVRTLAQLGVNVSVHSLLPAQRGHQKMLAERGLRDIPITHGCFLNVIRGLWIGLMNPVLFFTLIIWIIRNTLSKPGHLAKSLLLVPRSLHIYAAIKKERPDVVHLFWGHFPSLVGYLVETTLPQTVVSVFLGAYDLMMNYGCSGPVAKNADVVWTHAKANVELILALGVAHERIVVSYRGIDLSRVRDRAEVKHRIVSAGRLCRDKGMDDVLRIFNKVLNHWQDASLVILGDGPERDKLEELSKKLGINHAVSFKGHVSQEEVFEQLSQGEIFLFMSKASGERLPNVVKEAIASGCLCIVTETTGIEELLINNVHGYIVPKSDVEAALAGVNKIFTNCTNKNRMVEASRKHLSTNFNIAGLMQNHVDKWKRLQKTELSNI